MFCRNITIANTVPAARLTRCNFLCCFQDDVKEPMASADGKVDEEVKGATTVEVGVKLVEEQSVATPTMTEAASTAGTPAGVRYAKSVYPTPQILREKKAPPTPATVLPESEATVDPESKDSVLQTPAAKAKKRGPPVSLFSPGAAFPAGSGGRAPKPAKVASQPWGPASKNPA